MGFTRDYLQHSGSRMTLAFVEELGFTSWQAQGFLQAAIESIDDALLHGGVDPLTVLEGSDTDRLIEEISIHSLATRLGISEANVHAGLVLLAPDYLTGITERVGGTSALGFVLRGGGPHSPQRAAQRLAHRLG